MVTTNRQIMLNCPTCDREVVEESRFCSGCGSSLEPTTSLPTQTSVPTTEARRISGGSTSDELIEGRFLPGDVVAGRYRVVGLIGRGGMGEVYRADDLKLGQPVALKFLPEALEKNERRLERFLNEVKLARQVSHPNVCRVYDIGEVHGQHYLSMEYVDGEDLASLTRRIGRLEHDKAVQIARQICAGLAAIHHRGMVHRDLKPANVMIDGRGQVRITDFGLAGLARGISGDEIRAGTPDYMSPEQLSGKGVSVKSDLYALGLVLYELFTGKPAFRADTLVELKHMQATATPTSPSTLVSNIDPAVERVILRCLAKDPAERPASALAASAGLPGGDPLAAALAAGETPSPEMVAAAGPDGGLRPAVALSLLAVSVAALLGYALFFESTTLYGTVRFEKPFAVLKDNARDIAQRLGYTEPPSDQIARFTPNLAELRRIAQDASDPSAWESLADPSQRALYMTYRQSDRPLAPANFAGLVTSRDPPPRPGDVQMNLDLRGRLIYLRAVSSWTNHSTDPSPPTDWSSLFQQAGMEIDEFEPVRPTLQPQLFYEERAAWTGTHAPDDTPVRVEAASVGGRPVYFRSVTPDDPLWSAESAAQETPEANFAALIGFIVIMLVIFVGGAVILTLFNWRRGRGDRRGALRVALFVFSLRVMLWIVVGHHVPDLEGEFSMMITALGQALLISTITWLLYMALEPYVRRLWPEALVAWSRLLAGRLRDPLVGRDLLIGFGFGVAIQYLGYASHQLPSLFGLPALPPLPYGMQGLMGGRWALGGVFSMLLASLAGALAYTLLVLLMRIIFRKQWIAASVFCLIFAGFNIVDFVAYGAQRVTPALVAMSLVIGVITGLFMIVLILRFGLLATVGAFFVANAVAYYPITLNPDAPYFATSMLALLICIGLAAYAFFVSLGSRSLFEELVPEPH
jgi:serine/threonine-protein kinase